MKYYVEHHHNLREQGLGKTFVFFCTVGKVRAEKLLKSRTNFLQKYLKKPQFKIFTIAPFQEVLVIAWTRWYSFSINRTYQKTLINIINLCTVEPLYSGHAI